MTQKPYKRLWGGKIASREIGELVGVTRQAVEMWHEVPAEYVLLLERETGTPRYVIRPDLYPPEEYEPRRRHVIGEMRYKGHRAVTGAR